MPYIDRPDRAQYQELISELARKIPTDRLNRPGHLNFCISLLMDKVFGDQMRYADHNEVIGVLNCVLQEFYRRKTVPYEEMKIGKEGDLREF